MKPEHIYRAWWPERQKRTLSVTGPALPLQADGEPVFLLSAIVGEERHSTLCHYDLILTTSLDMAAVEAASIDLKAFIGTELAVTIELEGMGSVAGAMNARSLSKAPSHPTLSRFPVNACATVARPDFLSLRNSVS